MLDAFTPHIEAWSRILPLPWFTLIGSFLEEIVMPLPSQLLTTLAGSVAETLGHSVLYLVLLAIIATIGKTAACYLMYLIADKLEIIFTSRYGKLIGFSHAQLARFGERLGKGWRGNLALFLFRAVPVMPTSPVSIASGVLKLNRRSYLWSTALGLLPRNFFYVYLGYTVGTLTIDRIRPYVLEIEAIGSALLLVFAVAMGFYIYRQRRKR